MNKDFIIEQLGINIKTYMDDLKELCYLWNEGVGNANMTLKWCMMILLSIVKSYLRGRDIRMGTITSFHRHIYLMVSIISDIICATRQNIDKAPNLKRFDLSNESVLHNSFGSDILADAEKILREKREI